MTDRKIIDGETRDLTLEEQHQLLAELLYVRRLRDNADVSGRNGGKFGAGVYLGQELGKIRELIHLADKPRRALREEFEKDMEPGGFYHSYVANVACAIYDCNEIPTGKDLTMEDCTKLAHAVLKRIFWD